MKSEAVLSQGHLNLTSAVLFKIYPFSTIDFCPESNFDPGISGLAYVQLYRSRWLVTVLRQTFEMPLLSQTREQTLLNVSTRGYGRAIREGDCRRCHDLEEDNKVVYKSIYKSICLNCYKPP